MDQRLADALAPLAQFVAENIGTLEVAVARYEAWGVNRLEAVANGYIDLDD